MSDRASVGYGLWPAAFIFRARNAILRPHFHRHADDIVSLFAQQKSGNAGIHSPAHPEQQALIVSLHWNQEFRRIAGRVNARAGTLMNGLPRKVKRQSKWAERVMPIRRSATTSTVGVERERKQCRGSEHRSISWCRPLMLRACVNLP